MNSKEIVENLQELLAWYMEDNYDSETVCKREAVSAAIKDVKEVEEHNETFEWCDNCKEYDQEHHCCHRWSKQIKKTCVEVREYHDDTLKSIALNLKDLYFCPYDTGNLKCHKHYNCFRCIYNWMKNVEEENL